ncbi:MAG: hypothetical protein GY820_39395 [Gammaproteobacteria bacterium]|nr:hypothetical protein [Gammaproteobacteria bacterium]
MTGPLECPTCGGDGPDIERCANCGVHQKTQSVIIGMDDGEWVCSLECEREHEIKGCPFQCEKRYRCPACKGGE